MKSTIYGIAFILASFGAFSAIAFHHTGKAFAKSDTSFSHETDKISGDWDGIVEAPGVKVPFKLTLKLDGKKVTEDTSHVHIVTKFSGQYKFLTEAGLSKVDDIEKVSNSNKTRVAIYKGTYKITPHETKPTIEKSFKSKKPGLRARHIT